MSKLLKQLNDNQNKVADTNGIMKLQAWDYGVAQDLTNKKITATVANASGFLFDLDLVSNGTEIDLDFKDSQLQKLTPDTYFLEIKVTDEAGDVSVFPTEGYAIFTINKNLHATEGALVPQITFDTVLADVKKAVDKKVADYTSTIAKGDKGDTGAQGPAGKDAEIPIIGGRNYIPNSQKARFRANTNVIQSVTVEKFDDATSMLHLVNPAGGSINAGVYIPQMSIKTGDNWTYSMDIKGTGVYNRVGINNSSMPVAPSGNVKADWTRVVSSGVASIDNDFVVLYFNTKDTPLDVYIKLPKLEAGNIATDWTPAPEDIDSAIAKAPKLNGNNMYVGDNTYMGTNTFMDGVSLNGKNEVNNLTDTDWLDIPLAEGRTGTAKYKVSLGKVSVHIDGVKGVTAIGNNAQGQIGTLPVNPSPYYTRNNAQVGSTIRGITIAPNGVIYVANEMGNAMSENDAYFLDTVLM